MTKGGGTCRKKWVLCSITLYLKIFFLLCWESNPGLHACSTSTLSLHYIHNSCTYFLHSLLSCKCSATQWWWILDTELMLFNSLCWRWHKPNTKEYPAFFPFTGRSSGVHMGTKELTVSWDSLPATRKKWLTSTGVPCKLANGIC
jgi:hypothetical protein